MLAFGLALGSLAYKQQVLASASTQSQYAFYAADAGLECALYADQKQNLFTYPPTPPGPPASAPRITCDGVQAAYPPAYPTGIASYTETQWIIAQRLSLDNNKLCADVTIYKPNGTGQHFIFSQGYDVPCATVASPGSARFVARGISVRY